MTAANFQKYCNKNKVLKIETNVCSITFYFKNGKRIDANCAYDGLEYSFWKKPKKDASKKLLSDLVLLAPDYYKKYAEKYSQSFDFGQ